MFKFRQKIKAIGQLFARGKGRLHVLQGHVFILECYDGETGKLLWADTASNLMVNEGLNDYLNVYYRSSAYTTSLACLLTDSTPVFAPGDTMTSHPGWTENQGYSEAVRQALLMDPASNQAINNDTNKCVYNMNAASTIGGMAICTDNTKGGIAGTLVAGAALDGGDQPVIDGNVFNLRVVATAASA